MENLYSASTADQARKTAQGAEKLVSDVKKDFDAATSRGRDAASSFADDVRSAASDAAGDFSDRARETAGAARRKLGQAAGKVSDYADANTALVAFAAFGIGLLVGHLVTRES